MNKKNLKLSIVIPCYNESDNLAILIRNLSKIDKNIFEIILVNNGSTDKTKLVLKSLIEQKSKYKLVNLEYNIGYGHGIMSGVKETSGDIIAWTHADLQTNPKDIINAFDTYINIPNYGNSIIKGKRINRNFFDFFFTYCMGLISSFILNVKVSDINAQPKMFHRNFLNELKNHPNDFSLDLYFLYIAKIKGYKIHEYPVKFEKRIFGKSKGGGTIIGKIKLITRTFKYIFKLKNNI